MKAQTYLGAARGSRHPDQHVRGLSGVAGGAMRALILISLTLAAFTAATIRPSTHQSPERVYVVDRIEGAYAVLIDDVTAQAVDVRVERFPFAVREGMALVVPMGPQWARARRVTP